MSRSIPPVLKCLVPHCKNNVVSRGLCRYDYNAALQLVDQKKTTWEQLVAEGKALPKHGERKKEAAAKFFLSK